MNQRNETRKETDLAPKLLNERSTLKKLPRIQDDWPLAIRENSKLFQRV